MEQKMPEVGVARRGFFNPELRSIDEKARTITFVASDESVDRYGDVIRVSGWQLDNYKKNPVFLWGHKSGDPPIGRAVAITKESNPPALVQTIQFATKDVYPFADTVFNLYKGGFMRAVSVGFRPTVPPTPITDLESNMTGYEFTGQELLELSAVPIPANPQALARAVTKGFAPRDLEQAFERFDVAEVYAKLVDCYAETLTIAVEIIRRQSAALENQGLELSDDGKVGAIDEALRKLFGE